MRYMKRLGIGVVLSALAVALVMNAACENSGGSKLNQSGAAGGGGDLEARVKKLEETNAKYAEALDFLQKVYAQQKQQQAQQERDEIAPDGTFAVDVAADIKGGQVEGSNSACVTVVEAWDFA